MMRSISCFILLLTLLPEAGHAAAIRDRVEVDGAVIRLNDLFVLDDDRGDGGDTVVSEAPFPGKREIFGSHRLAAIAQRFSVEWVPQTRYDKVIVTRASRPIAPQEIEDVVRDQLAQHNKGDELTVRLSARNIKAMAPVNLPEPFRIADLRYDRRAGRFSALMIVSISADRDEQIPISGLVSEMVEIPVVNRRIQRGTVVDEGDVHWMKVEKSDLARDVVMDPASMIGQSARHILPADAPLRLSDLRAPIVIKKGEIVTVELVTPNMRITARAQAAHDASIGDTIRVINTRSKKTIEGIVSAPDRVVVSSASSILN